MAGGPTRQDTWAVNVRVEHVTHPNRIMLNCGVWDQSSGAEVDSDETKYPPGGMQPKVSLGGQATQNNITVSRLYRLVRDHQDLAQILLNGAGKARMEISHQPLDIDGNVFGRPIVSKGILKRCKLPEVDSKNSDTEARVELEMTPEGIPVV